MAYSALQNLWERSLYPNKQPADAGSWGQEMEELYACGVGMEETLRYLYGQRPSLEQFYEWLQHQSQEQAVTNTTSVPDTLSAEDLAFWEENGYVVINNAIPSADCEATRKAIWEFLRMDPNNKETWYVNHSEMRGLMLTFSNHPTLNKNRQSLKIRKAFEQLYKSTRIYKTIDKVSFNPPETPSFRFKGDGLHWDTSLKQPMQFVLQGLLYLTDCGANDGAFHCVPGFHNTIEKWLAELPAGANPRGLAPQVLTPVAVPGNAGDFVIWHEALPHCATPNFGKTPRIVQYLKYLPIGYKQDTEWI